MLTLKNLVLGYKSQVLNKKEINLTVPKNGFIGVIGKNGAGKSTLLKTIAGILPPVKGDVLFDGQNIATFSVEQRSRLFSFVFANLPNQLPLRVSEILALNPNHIQLNIEEAISTFELEPLLNKNFNTLSDGQKQRVILAKAFAQNTPILLLDEPETHLDISQNLKNFQILKSISKQKLVICASHDLHNILKFSDYLWLISTQGILAGETGEFLNQNVIQSHFELPEAFIQNHL